MFRELRRKKQLLPDAETIKILKTCTAGVLAVAGDNGYPYAVPLSYVYQDGKLYFHFAQEGHKLDSIARNDKVSFCVIAKDEVIQLSLTTHYRSVIVFGRARILEDEGEKKYALACLADKYSPDFPEEAQKAIAQGLKGVGIAEVTIEHMTGKTAIELINSKAE
jgi:uncharacterized protein